MANHLITKNAHISVPVVKGKSHTEVLDICRDMIAEYTPEAVALIVDTMKARATPLPLKIRCAETLIERHMGKPIEEVKAAILNMQQIIITRPGGAKEDKL